MKSKVNYTESRVYRDFRYIEEEEETPIKRPILLKRNKSILEKIVAFFKGK